jgi:hypothetical protein
MQNKNSVLPSDLENYKTDANVFASSVPFDRIKFK